MANEQELRPEDSREWYDVLGRFRTKTAEFAQLYNRLLESESEVTSNPALSAEREKLLRAGTSIKDKVMTMTNAVDEAYAWLKGTFGLGELGAIPLLIPVAAAAVAVTAMTAWITNAIVYFDKADRWQEIAQEFGPDAANKAIATMDPSLFGGVEDMVKALLPFVLIAGGVWFFRDRIFAK